MNQKKIRNKSNNNNNSCTFNEQYYEDIKLVRQGQTLAYILAALGVLAYVAFFIFGIISKKFDFNVTTNQKIFLLSAINIMIITVDVIFIFIYRGKVYSKESTAKKGKKEGDVRKDRINCDIFLLELSVSLILIFNILRKYNFSNELRWGIVIIVIAIIMFIFLHLVKLIETKKFGVNFPTFIISVLLSIILTFSLVNITASYSYENVKVIDTNTYISGTKTRTRVYKIEFEYSDGKTEKIGTTKQLYEKANYLSYGFYLEDVTGIFGLKMHKLCYKPLF